MAKFFFLIIILLLIFFFISLPLVLAGTAGSNYDVGSSVLSIQGANISGDNYESRINLAANAGGDAQGEIYQANIGFLKSPGSSDLASLTLSIISPKNGTYLDKHSIPLNYSATYADSVWYNLDSGENITITSFIYFDTEEGEHTLYLYANSSAGEIVMQNISFSVDPDKFKIKCNKWKGSERGNSTNFTIYSYEELQNLSEVVLEQTGKGKVHFNENLNLIDINGEEIDLDSFINISTNRIEVDSNQLPNLNKSATLSLYGLTFTNPRILKDDSVCPPSICTKEGYSGGILKFNATGFSVYSSEETPVEATSPSGAGGGAAIIPMTNIFSVDIEQIKVSLTQGSIITKKIAITNNLNKKITISLDEKNLEDFLIIKNNQFELNPKESKEISLDIMAREDALPGLYLGKLIVKNGNQEKEILMLIEIESKGALFDLNVKIPDEYLNVLPDKKILAEIKLFNLGAIKRADIEIDYTIKNRETGEEISTEKETLAIETQASLIKEIKIPKDIKKGKYTLYVKLMYEGKISSATADFNVIEPFWKFMASSSFIQILLITLIGIAVFVFLRKIHKSH